MTAYQHYKEFLAQIYSWSLGEKADLFQRNKEWLKSNNITSGTLLDLGAGFGSHAIPASESGLKVTAVDFSQELLAEINSQSIKTVESDILSFLNSDTQIYDHVLCLGDTLTHLKSIEELNDVLKLLSKNKNVYLAWRDYQTLPILDSNRFIKVREDQARLMTCVLEDFNDQQIKVTDILHSKSDGTISGHSYYKLKLTPEFVSSKLKNAGLEVKTRVQGRLVELTASSVLCKKGK